VSVLLRQPHGFEGFGVVPEELHEGDLALAHCADSGHLQVGLRAIARAAPVLPHGYSVADIDEVADRLQGVGVPGLCGAARTTVRKPPDLRKAPAPATPPAFAR
jgi:hypothetical protein